LDNWDWTSLRCYQPSIGTVNAGSTSNTLVRIVGTFISQASANRKQAVVADVAEARLRMHPG
jgi:hypothetical protein